MPSCLNFPIPQFPYSSMFNSPTPPFPNSPTPSILDFDKALTPSFLNSPTPPFLGCIIHEFPLSSILSFFNSLKLRYHCQCHRHCHCLNSLVPQFSHFSIPPLLHSSILPFPHCSTPSCLNTPPLLSSSIPLASIPSFPSIPALVYSSISSSPSFFHSPFP